MKKLKLSLVILTACFSTSVFAELTAKTDGTTLGVVVTISDSDLTKAAQDKLAQDATLKGTDIKVKTEDGVVMLEGSAGSQVQITEAITIVKSIPGVKEVKSTLTVTPDATTIP